VTTCQSSIVRLFLLSIMENHKFYMKIQTIIFHLYKFAMKDVLKKNVATNISFEFTDSRVKAMYTLLPIN
jgi:hypothetical protein